MYIHQQIIHPSKQPPPRNLCWVWRLQSIHKPTNIRTTSKPTKHILSQTKCHNPSHIATKHYPHDTFILIDNMKNSYLIKNPHKTPLLPTTHPNKLHITTIVNQIKWSTHKIIMQNVRAHNGIIGNEVIGRLANDKTNLNKPNSTTHIHIAHTTP